MPVPFSRTMRSLRADRAGGNLAGVLVAAALLSAWGVWLCLARVGVYAVSAAARLEAGGAIQPIQSLFAGRVAANHLALGRRVKRGELLIALDMNIQHLQLLEEQVQSDAAQTELGTLRKEIEAERRAMRPEQAAAGLGVEEARARLREAEASAAYAALDLERKSKLHAQGLASQMEAARAGSELEKLRSTVDGLKFAIRRQRREQQSRNSERQSRIEGLRRQIDQLSGLRSKLGAAANRLQSEIELRRVTAPMDGMIGEAANLRIGSVISAGERLGAIIPDGGLKVIAQFEPAKALGGSNRGSGRGCGWRAFPGRNTERYRRPSPKSPTRSGRATCASN